MLTIKTRDTVTTIDMAHNQVIHQPSSDANFVFTATINRDLPAEVLEAVNVLRKHSLNVVEGGRMCDRTYRSLPFRVARSAVTSPTQSVAGPSRRARTRLNSQVTLTHRPINKVSDKFPWLVYKSAFPLDYQPDNYRLKREHLIFLTNLFTFARWSVLRELFVI
jgi:hypothetical protein